MDLTDEIKKRLGDLTFLECNVLATELARATNAQEAIRSLDNHWERCILQARVSQGEETNWEERCRTEAVHNR